MKLSKKFTGKESVVDLIEQDYNILPILSRFNIPLGFQNRRIDEVCAENGIDTNLFLFIINFILSGKIDSEVLPEISPIGIVEFLHNSHDYFLRYKLPRNRQNLIMSLDDSLSDINPAIIMFFDEYIKEVKKHFEYEETKVFPYIRSLVNGEISSYNINIFRRRHDEIAEKLSELKNIILRFYPTSMPNKMYDVLVDLYNAEEDLDSHADIENLILIPLIASIENRK